ncbi:UDP-N-acetylmuramoyl-tripeptide--D-alanyl-D-alanine ligase [Devosia nitrariae]|uniref:UDP-N-acetylmuramoyl-tripeptide--D-alanyl-D-alanine ligase n=1 Tax=Devosia nitrariae TaxID=2071872 RepID=A0ABQ5W0H8_9HYPH|nr:UDP-N-acetylmuramoyl-tripeptide--D-alanyl-D-alanine ligase [Devosia nitrariae]GLQ53487.1 UDP-N-acetylmuramoyl-tripeptide--D-alanyl-D-alanine ligase [Devosia nitrariae]
MAPLFTRDELADATGGTARGLSEEGISSISIDSRDIALGGALFVAIKGERFDGHDFVDQALENGAAAAMVSQEKAGGLSGPILVVPDALEGLEALARAARARSRAQIVAVTGSVGKTTTKEALRLVFSAAGNTHASIKSFNNHWGVPLTLARLPRDVDFGVFEIGMNHAGEITPLVKLVRPHIAVITSIAPAHLDAFGSLEGIARAKAEIFSGLEPGGTALIGADHDQLGLLRQEAERAGVGTVVTYGLAPDSDWQVTDYQVLGDAASAEIRHGDEHYRLTIAAPGRHMVANAAGALATAVLSGIDPSVALGALAAFGAQAGRGQKSLLGEADVPLVLTDESYNANTASMRAALEVFASQEAPGGRKIVVLGDMLELGKDSAALHASLADAVGASGADRVYLVGEHMWALAEALEAGRVTLHAKSAEELAEPLLDSLAYGDAVMVKGSNGMRLAGLVQKIRDKFQ